MLLAAVIEHFITRASHHWIMNFCICRSASNCKDYPIELGCLFMGEAVLGINPKLGRLVSKAEALDHIHRCQEAGLIHLIGRNNLDALWLGVQPANRLLTVCNCCPCCCLYRMLPYLSSRLSAKFKRMPRVSVTITDRCTGCGICTVNVCFVNAIHVENGRAIHSNLKNRVYLFNIKLPSPKF